MDVKLWDLKQFSDFWNATYPSIILLFLRRFKNIPFSSSLFEYLTLWATVIETCVLLYSLQYVWRKTYSRQKVNNVFRKPSHRLKMLSFWMHKVGMKAPVNELLCDPSCPRISLNRNKRQGTVSRKDSIKVE